MDNRHSLSSAQVLLDLCVDYLKACIVYNEDKDSVALLEADDCAREMQQFLQRELRGAGFPEVGEEGLDDEDWDNE